MDNSTFAERDLWRAVRLGLKCRCPTCGGAALFRRYLKPVEHCSACGQDWTPQRADDLPAYLVILVLGHLIVPMMIEAERAYSPPIAFQMLFWPVLAMILAVLMLQPAKGAVIGIQWARRMHGFGGSTD